MPENANLEQTQDEDTVQLSTVANPRRVRWATRHR